MGEVTLWEATLIGSYRITAVYKGAVFPGKPPHGYQVFRRLHDEGRRLIIPPRIRLPINGYFSVAEYGGLNEAYAAADIYRNKLNEALDQL